MNDAINKIKEAEEKANKIIDKATKNANDIILKANDDAKKYYENNINDIKDKLAENVKDKGEKLKSELQVEINDAIKKAGDIEETLKEKGLKVVREILEDLLK